MWATALSAADITPPGPAEQTMGCALRLGGPIVEGDSQRLADALAALDTLPETGPLGRRLCLDSTEGSLLEATRLGDILVRRRLGTAVAAGARCEGACAVVFMAGQRAAPAQGGTAPDRVLHPGGRLGMHAPPLDTTTADVTLAYRRALASLAEVVLFRDRRAVDLPESVLLAILATPPNAVSYVNTVGQAARWGIAVAPVGWPDLPDTEVFSQACRNALARLSDRLPEDLTPSPDPDSFRYGSFAGAEVSVRRDAPGLPPCRLTMRSDAAPADAAGVVAVAPAPFAPSVDRALYPYALFPEDTALTALPPPSDEPALPFFDAMRDAARRAFTDVAFDGCWVLRPEVSVVNVSAFVNLRAAAGFDGQVLREVPLGEALRVIGTQRLVTPGDSDVADRCLAACDAQALDPGDADAANRVQRCIASNIFWYEVRDGSNAAGFVSRKFLSD